MKWVNVGQDKYSFRSSEISIYTDEPMKKRCLCFHESVVLLADEIGNFLKIIKTDRSLKQSFTCKLVSCAV